MRVVALIGLGMDPRAVRRISSLVPVEVHHQIPHLRGESISEYAHRWAHHLQLGHDDLIMGMSFAGPIAMEMAKLYNLRGCILISTFTTPQELPAIHRRALNWGLHRWIPYRLGWWLGKRWARRNAILGKGNNVAIEAIERRTNPEFYRWIIDALGKWPGTEACGVSLRIHGTEDKILPINSETPGVEFIVGNHFLLTTAAGRLAISEKVDSFIRILAS